MNRFHLLNFIGVLASPLIVCAAPFQNLDFDSANTNNIVGTPPIQTGPIGELLPGWQLTAGTSTSATIGYNLFPTGYGFATIVDRNNSANYPVVGPDTLVLSGYMLFSTDPYTPLVLSQTGDIPADARSIHFTTIGSTYALSINGVQLSLAYDNLSGNFDPFGPAASAVGDISAFAGQTVQLQFTTIQMDARRSGINGLDDIYFSTTAVPEPSTLLLFSLGGLALLVRRFRQK